MLLCAFLGVPFHPADNAYAVPKNYPSIVIMPFENLSGRSEYNWIGESFATGLAEILDKPGLVSIHSDERDVAYKQEGVPSTAILTKATMIKIAERAGATLVVMGNYRIEGEGRDSTITVTARVVDIREGRLIGREHNYGSPILELQRLQGELAYEILYQQNPALPFSREQLVTQAVRAPIGAFESYVKGKMTRDREAKIDFFERAVKEHAEKTGTVYTAALFELGRTRYEAGDYDGALEQLEKIDEAYPRFAEALFYAGVARDMTGRTDDALASFTKLAQVLPLYEVYNNIGVLLIKKKRYEDAINHLKPAAEAAPRDTDVLFNVGYAHHLAGDHRSAVAALKREIERRPSDGESYYFLSKALLASGDQGGAEEASNQAKKLLSSFAQWETRGAPMAARLKNGFSKANYYRYKRDLESRTTLPATQSVEVDRLLGTAREAFFAGRDEDAIGALGTLLQAAPQNYEAHLLMGRLYERRGDFDRANNSLKAAIFWNPKLLAAHVLIGRIAVLKNDCKAAQSALSKALQVDAADQEVVALKRMVEQKCQAPDGPTG